MKIDDQMRFPHPVLWKQTNDYKIGEFSADFSITESLDSGRLSLQYKVILSEKEIYSIVDNGRAAVGLFVTCRETYFNELMMLSLQDGMLEILGGRLKGRVMLRPIVWSVNRVDDYFSSNLHEEFESVTWGFPKGIILALGEETVIHVGREKLVSMESIFRLSRNDDVLENQISLVMEGENIAILAPGATFEKIQHLRFSREGRAILLNSIYLPAVMEVLSSFRENITLYEDKRWNRIFTAKMELLGINPETCDILEAAQKLLKSPFERVSSDLKMR